MRKWPRSVVYAKPYVPEGQLSDISQKVRDDAKTYWRYYHYKYKELDDELATFLKCPLPYDPPLRGARLALGLTLAEVAARAGYSTSAYSALELRDVRGRATLAALKRAAHAMDCEVVLAIRPRGPRVYSDVLWDKLAPRALANRLLWSLQGDRQARFLAYLVGEL